MPLLQDLLKKLHDFLATSDLFKSVPLSLLLIGLEALLDPHFSCPCRVLQNRLLTVAIFIGPALFTFFLMFLFVRPFRHGWFHCPDGVNDDTQKNWPKVLISCLIPPVMWIFLLFHDGEYFTCGMTDWDGCYVFNEKLGRSWCHPYPEGNIMWCDTSSEDHGKMHHTLEYFHNSEFIGYCVISVFSVLAVVFVGIYDCFVTGKCDCLPNQLLCCCRRRLPYSGVSAMEGADVTLRANTEIQTGDEIFWMFGYDNSLVAKNTGEESEFSDDRFKDKVDLNPQTGNLTIKRIETIHTGKYKLKIIRNGKASFKKFNVTLSEQVNESVLKGDPVTLEYDTEIQRDDEIQWKFEEKLIAEMTGRNRENLQSSDEFRGQMKLDPQSGSLIIEETRSEHSGLYKLEINTRDYSTFRLFSLTVWVKSVSVMKGADVTLPANIEIQRGDEIFWMFGDHNWLLAKNTKEESEFSDDRFKDKVYLDHQTRNLTIKKTETDHTGEYKLKIIRNGKSSFKIFSVTVYDEEESVSVMEGADVTLRANPEIQRGDEIFWMFGDHNWLLAKNTEERCEEESECSDSRFKDKMDLNHQTGDLTIRKTETNHTGKYKLKIIRNGKSSFKLFTVTVSENQNTAGTAAAPDETTAAGSNQNQNTAESIEMSILTNQQNQETPLDSVVSQT